MGALEASEATELLTASVNGFKVSVDDALGVVDRFVAADLNFATSTGEIATALQRVASSASTAGLELDQVIGIVTTLSETTRLSAETIGNSVRTVIARFQNIKAGKFIDDEFGEPLNKIGA